MTSDILETMQAELDECIALLRPHYPDKEDDELRQHAMCLRPRYYETGRWPVEEIEADEPNLQAAAMEEATEEAEAAS